MQKQRIENDVLIITDYRLEFQWNDGHGGGFTFPCDEQGNVDSDLHQCTLDNLEKCRNGTYDVVACGVTTFTHQQRLCSCGSQEIPWGEYDARGIFLTYVCDKCRNERLSRYRPDVLSDSNYWHDEPIDY